MYITLWDKHLVSVICFLLLHGAVRNFAQVTYTQCLEQNSAPGVSTGAMFITVTSVPGYLDQIDFWVWTVRVVSE